MDNAFMSALGRVRADEELIQKTKDYIRNFYSGERSVRNTVFRQNAVTKRLAAAVCAFLLLVGCPIGAYAYYKTPTSYLSIDINPSIELGINAFGKVVTAIAYNADGETILEGQDVVNMDVKDAVIILITSASLHGFILEDGSTIISIISETNNENDAEELVDEAEEGAETAMDSEGYSAAIQKDNISLERRDDARELGISPGKLNLIQKLQELDQTITIEQYKDASVTDIQKKFTELKKEQNGKPDKDDSAEETSPENEPTPAVSPDEISPSGNGNGNGNGSSNGNGANSNGHSGGKPDDTDKPNGNNGSGKNQTEDDAVIVPEDENDKPGNGNSGANGNGNSENGNNTTGLPEDEPSGKPDNGNLNKPDDRGNSSNGTGSANNDNNNGNNGKNGRNPD